MLQNAMPEPLVSAIIVSQDKRDQLLDCLHDFYATSGDSAEAIVIDNASTDGTSEAVEREFPRTKLTRRTEDKGFSRAGNAGLSLAAGRFLLLLSPEVRVQKGCVRRMADFLLTHQEVGAVSPRLQTPDGTLEPAARAGFPTPSTAISQNLGLGVVFPNSKRFNRFYMGHLAVEEVDEVDSGSFACLMLRHSAVDKVGFLDPGYVMYGEDLDLCYRLKQSGWKVYYYPLAVAIRHRTPVDPADARRRLWEFHRSMWGSTTRPMPPSCPPSPTGSCGRRTGFTACTRWPGCRWAVTTTTGWPAS
jgi:GT2 family glycosyltransferase